MYCRSCLRKISVGVHVVRRNLAELKIMRDSYILFLHYDMQAIHTSKIDFFPLVQQKNIDCFESGINMFFKNLIMIRHLFCSIGSYDTVCSSQCSLLTIYKETSLPSALETERPAALPTARVWCARVDVRNGRKNEPDPRALGVPRINRILNS